MNEIISKSELEKCTIAYKKMARVLKNVLALLFVAGAIVAFHNLYLTGIKMNPESIKSIENTEITIFVIILILAVIGLVYSIIYTVQITRILKRTAKEKNMKFQEIRKLFNTWAIQNYGGLGI